MYIIGAITLGISLLLKVVSSNVDTVSHQNFEFWHIVFFMWSLLFFTTGPWKIERIKD